VPRELAVEQLVELLRPGQLFEALPELAPALPLELRAHAVYRDGALLPNLVQLGESVFDVHLLIPGV
jgi:hypothetical protein